MKQLKLLTINGRDTQTLTAEQFTAIRSPLHHALQLASIPGRYLSTPRDDDSHTNLGWISELNAFGGRKLKDSALSVAIRVDQGELLLLNESDNITAAFSLTGNLLSSAFEWLRRQLNQHGLDTSSLSLDLDYAAELPEDPYAENAPFPQMDEKLSGTLAAHFNNASQILEDVRQQYPGIASEVRCWPHHFDMATLITFDKDTSQKLESIGVGFSPGDQNSPMPYYYVTPWPYPDAATLNLPELPFAGKWHTEGWLGASQSADNFQGADDKGVKIIEFLQSAFNYLLSIR